METSWAYANGEWMPGSALRVAVDDAGFLLGVTVTERLRTFGGRVFQLDEHLRRFRRSLEIVGLAADEICGDVTAAVPEFLRRNGEQIAADDDWSIVAFATPGVAGSGRPTVCVHGHPLPFQQWAALFDTGVRVVISHIRQVPSNCWPAELKCRSRMHYYLADREAATRQPGARAILLDQEGAIAEASTANVLVFRKDEGLISPPSEHILPGVSLGVAEVLAKQLSIPFVVRKLEPAELRSADEAMLTSTSVCMLPIVECDGAPIGSGKPGPVYQRFLAAWGDLVGLDIAAQARRYANR